MSGIQLPRSLIIIQVIFGSPLKAKQEFRAGDIAELTTVDIGIGNHTKVLDRLAELGWLRVSIRKETETRGGRPGTYLYTRTAKGQREYAELAKKLARYGILLE